MRRSVVRLDEAETAVELQVDAVFEFDLVSAAVALDRDDALSVEARVDDVADRLRHEALRYAAALAVDLRPVTVLVEFDGAAVGEENLVFAVEERIFGLDVADAGVAEMVGDQRAGCRRQLFVVDRAVAVGQRRQAALEALSLARTALADSLYRPEEIASLRASLRSLEAAEREYQNLAAQRVELSMAEERACAPS